MAFPETCRSLHQLFNIYVRTTLTFMFLKFIQVGLYSGGRIYRHGGLIFGMLIGVNIWGAYIQGDLYTGGVLMGFHGISLSFSMHKA